MHFSRSHLQKKKISSFPTLYKSSLNYPSFYFFLPLILLFQIFFAFRFLLYQKISYQIGKLSKKNLISKKSSSQISNIFFHVQSTHSKCTWHSSGSLLLAWPGKSLIALSSKKKEYDIFPHSKMHRKISFCLLEFLLCSAFPYFQVG